MSDKSSCEPVRGRWLKILNLFTKYSLSSARDAVFGILRHGVMGCECLFTLHVHAVCDFFHVNPREWPACRIASCNIFDMLHPGERQLSEIWKTTRRQLFTLAKPGGRGGE
jgi:hypothetical protein